MDLNETFNRKEKAVYAADLFSLCAIAPALIPAIAVVMAVSFADLKKNPIYKQTRIGKNGEKFTIYKIRTMRDLDTIDSSGRLKRKYNSKSACTQARYDRRFRTSNVGIILRKLKADELLQAWNVVKGDMAMVGPRPRMENDPINAKYPERLLIKPGITGDGKIIGNNDTITLDREGEQDMDYLEMFKTSSIPFIYLHNASTCAATLWSVMKGLRASHIHIQKPSVT